MSTTKPNLPELRGMPAVKRARLALLENSEEVLAEYRAALKLAIAHGKYAEGIQGYQWLMEHTPPDEDGVRMVEPSVDKQQKQTDGPRGPLIQIGFKLGGMPGDKALPEVIEIEPDPHD